MNLAPDDLQAIGDLIDSKLQPIKDDLEDAKNDLQSIGDLIDTKLKPIKRDLTKIKKDLKVTIATFDGEVTYHTKRLNRLEDHSDLPRLPR
jgi:hypothetical protein